MALADSNPNNNFRNAMRDALAAAFRPWVATAGVVNTLENRYRPDAMSDRVDIPIVGKSQVKDIKGAPAPTAGRADEPTKQTLIIDKWRGSDDLTITDFNRKTVTMSYFMAKIADMGAQLREDVETDLFKAIKAAANNRFAAGVLGQSTVADDYRIQTAAWRDATKYLMDQKAPVAERYAALGSTATAAAKGVRDWVTADGRGTPIAMMTGRIGMMDGVATYQTPLVGAVAAGTAGTPLTNGVQVKNKRVDLAVDGFSNGEGFVAGEVISFGSNPNVRYVIMSATPEITSAASTTAITLDRGLEVATVDNDPITRHDTDDSVIYHRECLAVAFMIPEAGPNQFQVVMGDPETGIVIRLKEIQQENQTKFQVDCSYGYITHRDNAAIGIRA